MAADKTNSELANYLRNMGRGEMRPHRAEAMFQAASRLDAMGDASDATALLWDGDERPLYGDRIVATLGAPGERSQSITITVENTALIIRGTAGRPALAIEPQASNAILVRFRDQ